MSNKEKMRWNILADFILRYKFKTFIEVGTANGKNLNNILKKIKDVDLKIWSIDPYECYDEYSTDINGKEERVKTNYTKALNTVFKDPRVIHIKEYSNCARQLFKPKSIDLIFIDANHSYKYVLDDIKTWTPVVRSGGIICGHDYRNSNGVVRAVNDAFSHFHILTDTVWCKQL